MELQDWWNEITGWKLNRYKMINFSIGIAALLIYEFIGRPFYRPYIYSHHIFDYHIADTLGNSLGTVATVFVLIALLTSERVKGMVLVKIVPFSVALYEIAHPVLGKPIDMWDIAASLLTGAVCFMVFRTLFHSNR